MSDSSFPFSPQSEPDGAPGPPPADPTGSSRNPLLIVGGVAGAAVLGIAAWLLLFSGGGDDETADRVAGPVRSGPKTPGKAATRPPPAPKPKPVPTRFDSDTGRNPFRSLATPPPVSSAPVPNDPISTVGGVTPDTGGVPGTVPGTGGTGTGGTGTGTPTVVPGKGTESAQSGELSQSATVPRVPSIVRLTTVAATNSSANVLVGSQTYVVRKGDVFATFFKLVRMEDGRSATFQYGDVLFDLKEGERAVFG